MYKKEYPERMLISGSGQPTAQKGDLWAVELLNIAVKSSFRNLKMQLSFS
jgi:hypothetical protein